jgi:hypothetical protein
VAGIVVCRVRGVDDAMERGCFVDPVGAAGRIAEKSVAVHVVAYHKPGMRCTAVAVAGSKWLSCFHVCLGCFLSGSVTWHAQVSYEPCVMPTLTVPHPPVIFCFPSP